MAWAHAGVRVKTKSAQTCVVSFPQLCAAIILASSVCRPDMRCRISVVDTVWTNCAQELMGAAVLRFVRAGMPSCRRHTQLPCRATAAGMCSSGALTHVLSVVRGLGARYHHWSARTRDSHVAADSTCMCAQRIACLWACSIYDGAAGNPRCSSAMRS